ncbi:hypothetical protein PVBG_05187 [Plasmodium vivax Brazil I]|uniref:PIR Superfamily Protein n=1 Tax=Plasmodium vivax (strain Brazil I) TaxID=1033975 RepID=A0A0J9SMI4_PLAV1|nr:hypothetical protein PVBG_05187 [Plasmodium vivax Brazil I]
MSLNTLNIEQMKNDYPFLKELWDLYDGFDKPVKGHYKDVYDGYCNLVKERLNHDKVKGYDICMKLIRNLDPSSKVSEKSISPTHRCINVNNWLYNSKEKKYLNNKNIIDWIFELSWNIRSESKNNGCSYYSYDTQYEEPINIIQLKMFDDNINIIKSTLKNENHPNITSAHRYLCKFVKLHKKMYSSYCSHTHRKTNKENRTCGILDTLKSAYNMFHSLNPDISPKIPSLEAREDELLAKCPSIQAEHTLHASVDGHSGSSTSKISTTIGTMAGVSSVFALLYKVNTKFYLNV